MRKTLSLALCALALLALLLPPAAISGEGAFPATVTKGPLHLRKEPDKKSASLGRYPTGTKLEALADAGEFCRVRMEDGRAGYMMKAFLDFPRGLPPQEVVTPTPAPTPDLTRHNALARGIDPNRPMVALTFDDGPQPSTEKVLEVLDRFGARATFFILGKNIAGNEETLRNIARGGHELGTHSWSHPNFTKVSASVVESQTRRTMDKVFELTGQMPRVMRPPYGATDRLSRRPLAAMGLPIILWKVDSLDWKTRNARQIVSTVQENVSNGAIVLMHDVWESTALALETLLPALSEKGYQFVTVSELFSFRSEPIKAGWEYSALDVKNIAPGLTPVPPSPAPVSP